MSHLPLHRLEADAARTPDEQAHLDGCPTCQLDARWLADDGHTAPALHAALPSLDRVRASWAASTGFTMVPIDDDDVPTHPLPVVPAERFELGDRLGRGGMGEVFRVTDTVLERTVALKVVSAERSDDAVARARFVGEARVGGRLQHPGILPVHDLGALPDGRAFFTMKEVDGTTLRAATQALHRASSGAAWRTSPDGTTLRSLLLAFTRVCDAVAYAHAQGVVHRDLKPDNVMLGAFGEVLVLDWGLAKAEPGQTLSGGSGLQTRAGTIAGTPAYMAPEQARGDVEAIGPPADVYALGAMLYEILTGRPPYVGPTGDAVVEAVVAGAPPPVDSHGGAPIPEELVAVVGRAMQRAASDRPATADVVGAEVMAWLDGAHRRDKALAVLADVRHHGPAATRARAEAAALHTQAAHLLQGIASHAPVEHKRDAWALQDRAAALDAEARVHATRLTLGAQQALAYAPDLPEAHALLAEHHRTLHAEAEAAGSPDAAALEVQLRAHDRGEHAAYLAGTGHLRLRTEPDGAAVEVLAHRVVDRRLVATATGEALTAPIDTALPMGSYLLRIRHPDRAPADLPVHIRRAEAPDLPTLVLPTDPPDHTCFVPAGWFLSGGDPGTPSSLPGRRVWVDGFHIDRDPVTIGAYLAFLDDLIAQGRDDEAVRHAPQERPTEPGVPGRLLVDHEPGVGMRLRPDAEGDLWDPDWPVWMVSWADAMAFAAWRGGKDGRPWRLPWELEWEKAARGVDGRAWPWGDFADPTWAAVDGSRPGRPQPARVDAFPVDVSPYGVRGMAGNVCDWTMDVHSPDGPVLDDAGRFHPPSHTPTSVPQRVVRGGLWSRPVAWGRCAFRAPWDATDRRWAIGFRLACPA